MAQLAAQWPPAHAGVGALHGMAQPPQFIGSVLMFTHAPPHGIVPVGQVHAPFTHCWVAPHVMPHLLQFFGSVLRFTHVPAQKLVPLGQLD